MDSMIERRAIPGYEDRYEIDTSGQVYALFPFRDLPVGRKIGSRSDTLGYVKTWLSRNGQTKQVSVHRLLMLTFQPIENPHLFEVNHIDGNPSNNALSNLEWVTHQENIIHAHKVLDAWAEKGYRGEQINTAKLSADQVREIRKLYQAGVKVPELVRKFGVTQPNMRAIVMRKTWRHVE